MIKKDDIIKTLDILETIMKITILVLKVFRFFKMEYMDILIIFLNICLWILQILRFFIKEF